MEFTDITIIRCNDKGEWMELANKIILSISNFNILCKDNNNNNNINNSNKMIILDIPCGSINIIKRISMNTVLIICKNTTFGLRFNCLSSSSSSNQIDSFLQSVMNYKLNIIIESNIKQQLSLASQQHQLQHRQQPSQHQKSSNPIFDILSCNPSMLSIPSLQDPLVQEFILMLLHAEDFKLFVKDIKKLVDKINDR